MTFLLVALFVLFFVVLAFRILSGAKENNNNEEKTTQISDDCCGAHEVCEKDSLLALNDEVIYYDDEELDSLANKKEYTDQELELFKEIFYTLKEEDVAGWLKSLQIRNIQLPEILRDEVLLIISERRGI